MHKKIKLSDGVKMEEILEDVRHGGGGARGTSPESPCSKKPSNSNNVIKNNINKEQDRFLPIANVGRIMKKVIPPNGKISKDAKETVQECVSEFISFVTGEASDKCQREKRKTINGEDVLHAITLLGFEDYVNPLKIYLNKYRELEGDKLNNNLPNKGPQRLILEQQNQQGPCALTSNNSMVYSSTNIMSQQPFVLADQSFSSSLPFSPDMIQSQLQLKQEQIDNMWGMGEN